MREMILLRNAKPDGTPPPGTEERVRAQLHEAMAAELTALVNGPEAPVEATPRALPSSSPHRVRRNPDPRRRLLAVAATIAVLLLIPALVSELSRDADLEPVVDPPPILTPEATGPAPLDTYEVTSRSIPLWDGQRVPAMVVSPVTSGPWPQVILLPHELVRNEWTTFPMRHVHGMRPVAERLASVGATVIIVGHVEARGDAEAFLRSPENLRCAVAFARSGEVGDPDRVVVFAQGFAGYHALASFHRPVPARGDCVASGPGEPDVLVSAVGVYDLDASWLRREWPGDLAELDAQALPEILAGVGPPVLFADPPVEDAPALVADTLRTAALLDTLGVPSRLLSVPGLAESAWAPRHGPTARLLEAIAATSYRPDVPLGESVPPLSVLPDPSVSPPTSGLAE